ncbi:MAG: hypothetical protein EU549_04415 [Promethearchaeota archaeon]|nr:MAG: hypothetical protein EU549_04415 [Candidatus Lokiarchaeota archaeon]
MLLQIDLMQDTLVVLHYFSVILIFYLAYQIGRKIREDNLLSMNTGFTIYLITFGFYVAIADLTPLYPEMEVLLEPTIFPMLIIYLGGMITYIVLTEYEENKFNTSEEDNEEFGYPLTSIGLGGFIIFISLGLIGLYDPFISLLIVLIPFIIATNSILKKFKNLEIVKRRKPGRWFYVGLSFSGFSNMLVSFYFLIGEVIFIIRYFAVISGILLMVHGWRLLPSLSELDWMLKMKELLIIHNETSALLFKYKFTQASQEAEDIDSELAGSAMSGIDSILSEILASKGHIEEIEHSGNIVIFLHGIHSVCILIADGPSDEFRYRLEMFHLSFENQYKAQLSNFTGEITPFLATQALIQEYFTH